MQRGHRTNMRVCVFTTLAILVAFVAGCRGHGLEEKPYADDGVQWGPAVKGLQVGLARRTYEAGAAPGINQNYFVVQARNVSDKPLSILAPVKVGGTIPEKLGGDESVKVILIYDSAAGLKTAEFSPPNKPVVQVMEPGKSYNLLVKLSPSRFGMDRFVNGRITAVYSNAQAEIKYDTMGGEAVRGLWTGEARSGSVVVEVTDEKKREAGSETSTSSVQAKREVNSAGAASAQGGGEAK